MTVELCAVSLTLNAFILRFCGSIISAISAFIVDAFVTFTIGMENYIIVANIVYIFKNLKLAAAHFCYY